MLRILLVVDMQKDFCEEDGSLPVPGGQALLPEINRLLCDENYDFIAASCDWHPPQHQSFASQHPGVKAFDKGFLNGKEQVFWPDHCVQGTPGSEFVTGLAVEKINYIQKKGLDPTTDSYSAFRDNDRKALTGLHLKFEPFRPFTLDICGVALDYCVRCSAEDAIEFFPEAEVRIIEKATAAVTEEGNKITKLILSKKKIRFF